MLAHEVAIITEEGELITPEQARQRREDELARLYTGFAGMRDRWVRHRAESGVEARWRKANQLYHGNPEIEAAVSELERTLRDGPSSKRKDGAPRSKVVVNIVRPKVEQASARMCEILFPVDDRNWGIRPTPIPELADRMGSQVGTVDANGRPTGLTADQEAQAITQAAKEASERMQRSIDDNLTECQFNGECRKIIDDGVRLGTGILRGPSPRRKRKKRWVTPQGSNVYALTIDEKAVPASVRVDPWNVFFDPSCGNDHQRGRGVFERDYATRKELRALVGLPGYDKDAIRRVLMTRPSRVSLAEGRVTRTYSSTEDDSYELWMYHGEIDPEEFANFGDRFGTDDDPDPLSGVASGLIVMVNDVIIGALPSWISDDSLPYDVWTWRQADDSPHGFGLPDELEHQQRVITGAWRQVMDNSRNTLGGQIVMRQKDIIPANGRYEITPMKIWYARDDVVDVTKSFSVFEFASHIDELLKVAQAALNFSDMESGIPQLMSGERGENSPETVGGMLMLYNNANAVLRRRVKLYDDNITRPHIGRYYDFKMEHDPDGTIKGDFEVDARGSSSLIERDIQNQAMVNLVNITSNPRYSIHLKEREELKAILKAFRFNPDDLMKTEDQVAKDQENAGEQQDPRIVSAQMTLEAKKLEIEDNQRQREFDAQRNATDNDFRQRQLAYNQQREQAEFVIAQTDSEIKRDTALLREHNRVTVSREANEARERLGLAKIETDRQIFNAEASLAVRNGHGI